MSKLIKLVAAMAVPSLLLATTAFADPGQDPCQSFVSTNDAAGIQQQITVLATVDANIQAASGVDDPSSLAGIQACLADYSQLAYQTQLAPYVDPTSMYGQTAMQPPAAVVAPNTPLVYVASNFVANDANAVIPQNPAAPPAPSGLQSSAGGLHQASYLQSDSDSSQPKKSKTSFSWLN